MEKVAFLNLTYNSFNQNHIWKSFFEQGDQDSYNLYIHPKFKKPSLFSKYYIEKHIETAWGHFSLVEATIEMMKEALKDEENEYFVLISDSHFPLYDLDTTVSLIKERYPKMTFSKHFSFHTKVKSQKILRKGVISPHPFDEYNAVCQFFAWRRSDAITFIETLDEYSKYFLKDQVILADEFYFWAVARDLKMDFNMGQATTYSDWSIKYDENQRQLRTPIDFKQITKGMVDTYRRNNYLFTRKVTLSTIVAVDPLNFQIDLGIK